MITPERAAQDFDVVQRPRHYNVHPSGIECIEITSQMSICLGTAVKYVWRTEEKDGLQDLEKARFYLQYYLDHEHAQKGYIPFELLYKAASYEFDLRRLYFECMGRGEVQQCLNVLDQMIAKAKEVQ